MENDDIVFSGVDGPDLTLDVDPDTGIVIATPAPGFVGTATAAVGVRSKLPSDTSDPLDSQIFTVEVTPPPPKGPRVIASSLAEGVLPLTRDLEVRIQFDEPIRHRGLNVSAASLESQLTGEQRRPAGFSYDLISNTLPDSLRRFAV